jgi:hypothetical protein
MTRVFGPPRVDWTPAAIAEMRRMALDGRSSGQIGLALGVSRNAVIGKCRRIGISLGVDRTVTVAAAPRRQPHQAPRAAATEAWASRFYRPADPAVAAAPESPPASPVEPRRANPPSALAIRRAVERETKPSGPVTLLELRECHCRFIPGPVDGARTLYCGATKQHASPYCPEHRALTEGRGTPSERRAHKPDVNSRSRITGAYA